MKRWLFGVLAALVACAAQPSFAQSIESFYKGKTVTIFVGFTAGGNYDLYARLLAEFLGRHIPGQPNVLVHNRPGAGSLNAAQHVTSVAPPDGLAIAMTANALPLDQLLAGDKAVVDMKRARWLGNLVELTSTAIVWHTAPAKTIEELRIKELVFGSSGPSGETYVVPVIMNDVLGTKIKMVTGYPGVSEINLALERGEIQGRAGSWANVQQKPEWIKEKRIIPLLQLGVRKHPELGDTRMFSELVTKNDDKQIAELISSIVAISRAPWVAPNVPEDRVKALRAAFEGTLKDPEFLKTAAQRNMEISYLSGDDVEKQLRRVLEVSPALLARLQKVLNATK